MINWLLCLLGFHEVAHNYSENLGNVIYTQTCTRPGCAYTRRTTYPASKRTVCTGCWEYTPQCTCPDPYWREFYK